MPSITSRVPFNGHQPYRAKRPTTTKIIFLSLEGSVTEEEYFKMISDLFSEVKTKVQFISVAERAANIPPKKRTDAQRLMLSKCRPKQLVERINQFKENEDNLYEFSEHPDDEFWIVTDVDQNWSTDIIDVKGQKSYLDEWHDAIAMCKKNGYKYAVSNPFFEIWLLLHHDDPTDADKVFAVTDNHSYEKTSHFRTRLRELEAPLKDRKHLDASNYDIQNVRDAIRRAESLHTDKNDLCPKYFATTVYLLLQKVIEMIPDSTPEKHIGK